MGHLSANSNKESSFEEKRGTYFQTISRQQVYHFIDEMIDLNPIHQSECPIVPGLLLLQLLDEAYQYPSQLKIKFRAPLYAEQPIYLKKQHSKVWGYSQCHLYFEVEIKK